MFFVDRDLQPLIEEINLQSRLNHTNIVCYLGSVYEDGVLKILMEHVPGGKFDLIFLDSFNGSSFQWVRHSLRYLRKYSNK